MTNPEPAVSHRRVGPGAGDSDGSAKALSKEAGTAGERRPPRQLVVRIGDGASRALSGAQAVFLLATVAVVLASIVERYILFSDFTQADQVLSLTFTWLVFLGLPRAVWTDYSPRLGVARSWPRQVREYVPLLGLGAVGALFIAEAWSYVVLLPTQVQSTLAPLPIPAYWETGAVLVAAVVGLALSVGRMYRVLAGSLWPGSGFVLAGVVVGIGPVLLSLPAQATAVGEIIVLLVCDAPIAVALGVAGVGLMVNGSLPQISAVASELLGPMQNLALLAIPLFMLMGAVFAKSRLAADLSRFVRALFGWVPGGTGVACVATSALFANISGSAIADTAAIGSVYIPQLLADGYAPADAAAVQAAAGVIGVVFPPAIAMILFASVASVSLIPVFKAVVIPGLMVAFTMAGISVWVAHRRRIARTRQFSVKELASSIPGAIPVLLVPIILDGGIFSGVFTPEESGAVALLVASIFIIARRGMSLRAAWAAIEQGLDNMTLVMFILTSVSLLDYGFAISGVSNFITTSLAAVGRSPLLMLLVINIIFLIVHEFVDAGPTILVLVPLVLPAAIAAGVSPFQLAAIVAINSTIGAVLPPVGVNLYISSRLAGVDPRTALRKVWPYVAGSFVILMLVTLIPALSLWLAQ